MKLDNSIDLGSNITYTIVCPSVPEDKPLYNPAILHLNVYILKIREIMAPFANALSHTLNASAHLSSGAKIPIIGPTLHQLP